jgi:hypothetical protein
MHAVAITAAAVPAVITLMSSPPGFEPATSRALGNSWTLGWTRFPRKVENLNGLLNEAQ